MDLNPTWETISRLMKNGLQVIENDRETGVRLLNLIEDVLPAFSFSTSFLSKCQALPRSQQVYGETETYIAGDHNQNAKPQYNSSHLMI